MFIGFKEIFNGHIVKEVLNSFLSFDPLNHSKLPLKIAIKIILKKTQHNLQQFTVKYNEGFDVKTFQTVLAFRIRNCLTIRNLE